MYAYNWNIFLKEPVLFFVEKEAVWNKVLKMADPLPVKYEKIETMFCQKKKAEAEEKKQDKKPSVVSS